MSPRGWASSSCFQLVVHDRATHLQPHFAALFTISQPSLFSTNLSNARQRPIYGSCGDHGSRPGDIVSRPLSVSVWIWEPPCHGSYSRRTTTKWHQLASEGQVRPLCRASERHCFHLFQRHGLECVRPVCLRKLWPRLMTVPDGCIDSDPVHHMAR